MTASSVLLPRATSAVKGPGRGASRVRVTTLQCSPPLAAVVLARAWQSSRLHRQRVQQHSNARCCCGRDRAGRFLPVVGHEDGVCRHQQNHGRSFLQTLFHCILVQPSPVSHLSGAFAFAFRDARALRDSGHPCVRAYCPRLVAAVATQLAFVITACCTPAPSRP